MRVAVRGNVWVYSLCDLNRVCGMICGVVVRNSSWFRSLQEDHDALRGMLANTEALLAEERRLRLAAESSGKHNAEDARKLAELRRRLATGAQRAKQVEKLLCAPAAKVGLGMAEAGHLAAKGLRQANNQVVELQGLLAAAQGLRLCTSSHPPGCCCVQPFCICVASLLNSTDNWYVAGRTSAAEAHVEQLQKEKQEAEAALAQSRQELRQLSAAGSANPNFPAGMHRGATNKSLNPPLFKTVRASIQTLSGLHALQTDPFLVIWLRDRVSLPLRRRSCWEGRVAATL